MRDFPGDVLGQQERGPNSLGNLGALFWKKISGVQTRCIVKGEAQKSPLFWQFSVFFDFLRSTCSLKIRLENL